MTTNLESQWSDAVWMQWVSYFNFILSNFLFLLNFMPVFLHVCDFEYSLRPHYSNHEISC